MSRVLPLCAAFCPDSECVRGSGAKAHVAPTCGQRRKMRIQYADPTQRSPAAAGKILPFGRSKLRCPTCDGTGSISLDIQFLPDVEIVCPDCGGSRYCREASRVARERKDGVRQTLPALMEMSVEQAKEACQDLSLVQRRLQTLCGLGLGYLTLGEATPSSSGGEAQRLKLASEMGKGQEDTVFVFDEPTIGLHPLDVQTLLSVFQRLIASDATVLVIEHDLDLIRNADFVIDMGPGGGNDGGRIVVSGTPEEVRRCKQSVTGHYI